MGSAKPGRNLACKGPVNCSFVLGVAVDASGTSPCRDSDAMTDLDMSFQGRVLCSSYSIIVATSRYFFSCDGGKLVRWAVDRGIIRVIGVETERNNSWRLTRSHLTVKQQALQGQRRVNTLDLADKHVLQVKRNKQKKRKINSKE